MTIPWPVVIGAGCAVYLIVGFMIAIGFTLTGPPEWWRRVLWRIVLLVAWLPLIILAPVLGAIGGFFS